jgi:deoxyribodipyrimidine photolyase-related protein
MVQKYDRLFLILGDQLSPRIPVLRAAKRQDDLILMAEVEAEATYVRHHKKKIILILSAMRHFADDLRRDGWRVEYTKIDADDNSGSLFGEVERCMRRTGARRVTVTEPGEWRLRSEMELWQERLGVPVEILPDDRFLCSHREFSGWAAGRKALRMEYFYRDMRRRTGLLMDGDEPAGGQWNFDASNRKAADQSLTFPGPARFEPDAITCEVIEVVRRRYSDHFGAAEPFWLAVTPLARRRHSRTSLRRRSRISATIRTPCCRESDSCSTP